MAGQLPDESPQEMGPSRERERGHGWLVWLNHSLTLLISSVLAVVLMLIVGGLIAFMQFQTRLLNAMPNLTPGQLIEYVEAERRSVQVVAELYDRRDSVLQVEQETSGVLTQVRGEIDSFCKVLTNSLVTGGATSKHDRCVRFFRGVLPSSVERSTPVQGGTQFAFGDVFSDMQPQYGILYEDEVVDIITSLYLDLGSREKPTPVKDSIRNKVSRIVLLNADFYINLRSLYKRRIDEFNSICNEYNQIRSTIAYRRVSAQKCHDLVLPPYWADQILLASAAGEATQPTLGGGAPGQPSAGPTPQSPDFPTLDTSGHQRSFELVSNYMFYATLDEYFIGIKTGFFEKLLLSPGDYISIWLVTMCGALGGFMNILFMNQRIGKDPKFGSLLIAPIQGVVCALILYIILRSGVLAIADNSGMKDESTISPFFLGFVGIAAGLVAGRVIEVFHDRASAWLGGLGQHGDRWGFGLAAAMRERNMTAKDLADAVRVDEAKIGEWIDEKIEVPGRFQPLLAAVLRKNERQLFTTLAPVKG